MEPSAYSSELPAFGEAAEASEYSSEGREGMGLSALLIVLAPFALVAWFAIGIALYKVIG